MSTFLENLPEIEELRIAVALSGGPDSMALAHALSVQGNAKIFALTVDHGLREGSDKEAEQVAQWVKDWPQVTHIILKWQADKPQTRIMEEARKARYDLMAGFCREQEIHSLYLAHHMDDQAETFLLRLAAGSGLDGLAGMRAQQNYDESLTLKRPCLSVTKEELITYCKENDIPFVLDPSNEKTDYARPRLRAARRVLEEEGLTSKRLSVTAMRLRRARSALEQITDEVFTAHCQQEAQGIMADWTALKSQPEEILLRLLLKAIDLAGPARDYPPRMEKVEDLLSRLLYDSNFSGATLGGCKFAWKGPDKALYICKE